MNGAGSGHQHSHPALLLGKSGRDEELDPTTADLFPPPGDQRQTPRVPRAGSLCRDPFANVPTPCLQLEEDQICVYVLQEEKQHDAAVTF